MENIQVRKDKVLTYLRNNLEKINEELNEIYKIEEENEKLREEVNKDNESSISNVIKILNDIPSINIKEKLDNLVLEEIKRTTFESVDIVINIIKEYLKDKNYEVVINLVKCITEKYITKDLTIEEIDAVNDIFVCISEEHRDIIKEIKYHVINHVVKNNLEDFIETFIRKEFINDEVDYFYDYNIIKVIRRIKNILIINKEFSLKLDHAGMFFDLEKYLEVMDINTLDLSLFVELMLVYSLYGVSSSALEEYELDKYEYNDEIELYDTLNDIILRGKVNKKRVEELSEICSGINKYLVKSILIKYLNNIIVKDNPIVEVVNVISKKTKECPACNTELEHKETWLAYYTDGTQERYNGVIPTILSNCEKCNKYYSSIEFVVALEEEVAPDILKYKQM